MVPRTAGSTRLRCVSGPHGIGMGRLPAHGRRIASAGTCLGRWEVGFQSLGRVSRPVGETHAAGTDGWVRVWRPSWLRPIGAEAILGRVPRTRVVLATAHRHDDTANNAASNLAAWCQRGHLLHDRPEHHRRRWLALFRRKAMGRLFCGPYG